ncbi:hypothetical protein EOD41_16440 [Mucilaginibacter limnophilus]|uniref:Uncharacterized protein n=1 Tax=Mucilaginibacter limnophilus TaxID=1932778 RepID=A0A437ML55_9SPHI|nr:hypothetical protein [Mucilaginibacter limnophilus]RVT98381.1 hypothetical protein EOD41_16440 [Mucilaginibacter limnophilus]
MKKHFLIMSLVAVMALSACGGNGKSASGDSAVLDSASMESTDTLEGRGPGVDPPAGQTDLDSIKPDGTDAQGHGDEDETVVDSGKKPQ